MHELDETRERAVCYLDLMGFSNAVYSAGDSKEKIELLVRILEEIEKKVTDNYSGSQLTFQHLSDSIFIATESISETEIQNLVMCIQDISLYLMEENFLVRGGISTGMCSISPSIIVGRPVVHAVKLEQQVAQNPRVVLGDSAVKSVKKMGVCEKYFSRGDDGIFWINPFPVLIDQIIELHRGLHGDHPLTEEKSIEIRRERSGRIARLNAITSFIQGMLERVTEEEKLYRRYFWLAKILDDNIKACQKVVGEEVVSIRFDL